METDKLNILLTMKWEELEILDKRLTRRLKINRIFVK